MRTKPFEATISLDADGFGLSDDVVSIEYDGTAIVTRFGIDDEDVEYRCEPGDHGELERIAANAARDPEAYARWVLKPYAKAFDPQVYAERIFVGYGAMMTAEGAVPSAGTAMAYYDAVASRESWLPDDVAATILGCVYPLSKEQSDAAKEKYESLAADRVAALALRHARATA